MKSFLAFLLVMHFDFWHILQFHFFPLFLHPLPFEPILNEISSCFVYMLSSIELWRVIISLILSCATVHICSNASIGKGSSIKTPTSSMQNKDAALTKVAGTTIHSHSSQRIIGRVRCQRTKNLDVNRVQDNGIGIPMILSHTLMLSLN